MFSCGWGGDSKVQEGLQRAQGKFGGYGYTHSFDSVEGFIIVYMFQNVHQNIQM